MAPGAGYLPLRRRFGFKLSRARAVRARGRSAWIMALAAGAITVWLLLGAALLYGLFRASGSL